VHSLSAPLVLVAKMIERCQLPRRPQRLTNRFCAILDRSCDKIQPPQFFGGPRGRSRERCHQAPRCISIPRTLHNRRKARKWNEQQYGPGHETRARHTTSRRSTVRGQPDPETG